MLNRNQIYEKGIPQTPHPCLQRASPDPTAKSKTLVPGYTLQRAALPHREPCCKGNCCFTKIQPAEVALVAPVSAMMQHKTPRSTKTVFWGMHAASADHTAYGSETQYTHALIC